MNYTVATILIMALLSGCASGIFSVYNGAAKLTVPFDWPGPQNKEFNSRLDRVYVDMPESELYELFKGFKYDVHRQDSSGQQVTFYATQEQSAEIKVTFYLLDGRVKQWEKGIIGQ